MTKVGDRPLSWREVQKTVGLSRSTVWRLIGKGGFPPPVQLSPGRVAWFESSITAWLEARPVGRPTSRDATTLPDNVSLLRAP